MAQGKEAINNFKQGRYSEAAGHGAAALLPSTPATPITQIDGKTTRAKATGVDELDRVLKKGGAVGKRLDFLMQDDRWVVAFCDAGGHPYTAVQVARAAVALWAAWGAR